MRTRTLLNEIANDLYNKKFKDLQEQELKDLAIKFNIPIYA